MKRWLAAWSVLVCLAGSSARAEMAVFDSCTDAAGRTVPAEMDFTLTALVQSKMENGQAVIRYNPQLLPRLSSAGRQFFFAHECARLALGDAGREPTPARARRADCIGVATLQGAGLLGEPGALRELQAELVFSGDEWAQLPGPRREFDLAACPKRSALKLPSAGPPSARQVDWDACVRVCADRSYRCQGGCKGASCGDGCLAAYNRCEAGCKAE